MLGCSNVSLGCIQENIHGCYQSNVTKVALFVIGLLFAGGAVASHFAGLGFPGIVAFSAAGGLCLTILAAVCIHRLGKALYLSIKSGSIKNYEIQDDEQNRDGTHYDNSCFCREEKDYSQAAEHFFEAAKNGNSHAVKEILSLEKKEELTKEKRGELQVLLAKCFEEGHGVEKDANISYDWYSKAAGNGNSEAKSWIENVT